jgi:DNA-binding response OmpR family regulator
MKILLLEDEYLLSKSIQRYLLSHNHFVDAFDNGQEVLEQIEHTAYDFYILDINTPLIGGLECLEVINARYPEAPKVIISAYHDIDHISEAYDRGCSDYLKKPFNLKELEIKIEKLSQSITSTQAPDPLMRLGEHYVFDNDHQLLLCDGDVQKLTRREHALMLLFISNMGQIITEETIESVVWRDETVEHATIRSLVNRLRTKLKEPLIENVRGFGYILKPLTAEES